MRSFRPVLEVLYVSLRYVVGIFSHHLLHAGNRYLYSSTRNLLLHHVEMPITSDPRLKMIIHHCFQWVQLDVVAWNYECCSRNSWFLNIRNSSMLNALVFPVAPCLQSQEKTRNSTSASLMKDRPDLIMQRVCMYTSMASPMLTTKALAIGFTGTHTPSCLICRAVISSSCRSKVIELASECGLTPRTKSGLAQLG